MLRRLKQFAKDVAENVLSLGEHFQRGQSLVVVHFTQGETFAKGVSLPPKRALKEFKNKNHPKLKGAKIRGNKEKGFSYQVLSSGSSNNEGILSVTSKSFN